MRSFAINDPRLPDRALCATLHPSIACPPRKRRDPIFLFRKSIVHFVLLYAGFPKRKSLFTISALMSPKPRVIYLCQSQEINFFLKMIDIGDIKATAAQFIDQVGLPWFIFSSHNNWETKTIKWQTYLGSYSLIASFWNGISKNLKSYLFYPSICWSPHLVLQFDVSSPDLNPIPLRLTDGVNLLPVHFHFCRAASRLISTSS